MLLAAAGDAATVSFCNAVLPACSQLFHMADMLLAQNLEPPTMTFPLYAIQ
jgi:hypothetical protein